MAPGGPPEERLRGVLDAMKVVGGPANDILRDAGYQPMPTLSSTRPVFSIDTRVVSLRRRSTP